MSIKLYESFNLNANIEFLMFYCRIKLLIKRGPVLFDIEMNSLDIPKTPSIPD